jgi:hypothetical protein
MDESNNKSNLFPLSFLAAACLLANISSYGGRIHNSYSGRKNASTKSHLNPSHPKKAIGSSKHIKHFSYIKKTHIANEHGLTQLTLLKKDQKNSLKEGHIDKVKLPQIEKPHSSIAVSPRKMVHITNPIINSVEYSLWQQLPPRVFLDGTLASEGFLYGDLLTPVFGNSDGFAFLNATGKGGTDKGYLGAFGAGLRQIWQGAIFGGYLFSEYDHTVFGNNFWTLNPGLEAFTPRWDFHINGYFPLEVRKMSRVFFLGVIWVSLALCLLDIINLVKCLIKLMKQLRVSTYKLATLFHAQVACVSLARVITTFFIRLKT